jgi:hypothetical protein
LHIRLLAVLPGLAAPVWLIVQAAQEFVSEWHWYFSLPVDVRTDGSAPLSASAGLYLAAFVIVVGLLLVLLVVSIALPRRVWLAWAILASVLSIGLAWAFGASDASVGLDFLYLPILAAVRITWQRRVDGEGAPPPRLAAHGHA